MAVRSTRGQNRAVRSTQSGSGVSHSFITFCSSKQTVFMRRTLIGRQAHAFLVFMMCVENWKINNIFSVIFESSYRDSFY